MEWASHLQVVVPGDDVLVQHRRRLENMRFIQPPSTKIPIAPTQTDGSPSAMTHGRQVGVGFLGNNIVS